jgi:hypothetical protein
MDAKEHDQKVRAARIESLKHTPAWDELASVLQQQEEKFWKRHIADLKNGDALDQRALDRALGKLDGIRAILSAPGKAASIMERLEKAEEEAS